MTITYNISYLIASIGVLIILGLNYLSQRHMDDLSNRFFGRFFFVGLADILLDLWTSVLLMHGSYPTITKILLSILYMLQALVLYLFFCYTQTLRNAPLSRTQKLNRIAFLPTAILIIMIILNYQEGFFFYFDDKGVYAKGPLYLVMYVAALIYTLTVAVETIVDAKSFGKKKRRIVWQFLGLAGVCVVIQAITGEQLTTGFGIALGIMVFCFTISNPKGYVDTLTGVFDKPYFASWMREKIFSKEEIYLLSIDAYKIKQLNKLYGNSIGDKLLVQIAAGLQEITESEYIFRMTGNRFIVVMRSLQAYEHAKTRVYNYFDKCFIIGEEVISCPAIICGIVDCKKLADGNAILDYIEYLVSLAKTDDGTVMILDNEGSIDGYNHEQEIERFINNEAIENDLFEVYYQPIVSLETGDYVTLEALSRLKHPVFGHISPDIFISIAEKSGQISKIGILQLHKICRFIKDNPELFEKIETVKINLSAVELMKPGHAQKLFDIIVDYGIDPHMIQFEITETVATEYSDHIYKVANLFKNNGIDICLDDFGSGYANLNTVLQLPFAVVKMDMTMLKGICDNERTAGFYESIVKLMQEMGYEVVAEGVETAEELELLTQFGVNMVQGYYFSKPVEPDVLIEVIQKGVKK